MTLEMCAFKPAGRCNLYQPIQLSLGILPGLNLAQDWMQRELLEASQLAHIWCLSH